MPRSIAVFVYCFLAVCLAGCDKKGAVTASSTTASGSSSTTPSRDSSSTTTEQSATTSAASPATTASAAGATDGTTGKPETKGPTAIPPVAARIVPKPEKTSA